MGRARKTTEGVREGVLDDDPLLEHYASLGMEFLRERQIDPNKTAVAMNELFDKSIYEAYLKPVLKHVQNSGVDTAAEHARRIGVDRATTSGWWNLYDEMKCDSRIRSPGLKTFLFTLVGFEVYPGGVLPPGRCVSVRAWSACIDYFERECLGEKTAKWIAEEELICLHLVWSSQEWKDAVDTGSEAKFREASEYITATIRLFVADSYINGLNEIRAVVNKWFVPGTIVFSLLKTKWQLT